MRQAKKEMGTVAKATSNIYLNKRETVSIRYIPLNTKRGEPEGLNHQ